MDREGWLLLACVVILFAWNIWDGRTRNNKHRNRFTYLDCTCDSDPLGRCVVHNDEGHAR